MFKSRSSLVIVLCIVCTLLSLSLSAAQDAMTYHQAPALDEAVASGALPPVEQRLPSDPLVVTPLESVGQYGGTWHMGTRGMSDEIIYVRTVGYQNLVRWNPDWTGILPDAAASFDVNDAGTVFTFHLRPGMKWSDGQPFTADDIVFVVNDIYKNTELFPSVPTWLTSGGQAADVTKVDDTTVQFTFAAPAGLFMQNLAAPNGSSMVAQPKHYLSQFHKSYVDAATLDKLVADAGADSWSSLFNQKGGVMAGKPNTLWNNAELPTIYPWMVKSPLSPEATQVELVRNPYFYKVDTEGNQLPYIDNLVYTVGADVQTLVLQALGGNIDMQDRHIATSANRAAFFDNQETGAYHFYETVPSSSNVMVISLNMTNLDLAKREIYQNKDFRIALSEAINRQEIIDLIYVGEGNVYQAAPRPQSPLYNERLAKQYTNFDPDDANAKLDAILPDKDSDGFRLMPGGERLVINVEVVTSLFPEWPGALELVKRYWADAGIDMQIIAEDRETFNTSKNDNKHDAAVWGGDGGLEVMLEPRWYFPFSNESTYAQAWQYWFNDPSDSRAEEPPAIVKQQMDLYTQVRATADPDEQNALMKQILDIAADQFYVMGIALPANGYGIVKNNMHNVPDAILNAYIYVNPGPTNTFTYYFSN